MEAFLEVVRALSHRDRVRIVKLLQYASLTAHELSDVMEGSEAETLDHLSVLRDAGLVVSVEDHRGEVFHINPDRSNLYGAVLLALLDGWLTDHEDIRGDRSRAEQLLGGEPH
jgi:DNA-binding transcriptional ArsR family regulator